MSSREHLAERAKNAIAGVRDEWDIPTDAALAAGVLNALLPQITEARQLLGVPENSILVTPDGYVYRVRDGALTNDHTGINVGKAFIEAQGPLTVVWMP
jgi:hypothetical protein